MAMPTIPTVAEIRARIISDMETAIGQTVPWLPKALTKVIAGAIAGIDILLYNSILWVYSQAFPDTADYDALVLLGKLVSIVPTGAVKAVITANVYGTNGESVAAGTTYFSTPGRSVYQVTTGGTIAGGLFLATLTALTAGEAANVANGVELSIVTPDTALTGSAIVVGTTTDGEDAESEEQFRVRVVARYKRRHTGGSPADYYLWGLEAPHFIWVSPVAGDAPGDVWVYGEVDNETDGIPTSAQLLTLAAYLTTDPATGLATRKPIGDTISCFPITRKVFNFEINISNSSTTTETAITAAIAEYLASLAPYNEGVTLERADAVTNTGTSSAANDVAKEAGAVILQLTVREASTGGEANNYMLYGGEKAKIGTATYTRLT
jgi:uncharacterized phage protein gp47/JayE